MVCVYACYCRGAEQEGAEETASDAEEQLRDRRAGQGAVEQAQTVSTHTHTNTRAHTNAQTYTGQGAVEQTQTECNTRTHHAHVGIYTQTPHSYTPLTRTCTSHKQTAITSNTHHTLPTHSRTRTFTNTQSPHTQTHAHHARTHAFKTDTHSEYLTHTQSNRISCR